MSINVQKAEFILSAASPPIARRILSFAIITPSPIRLSTRMRLPSKISNRAISSATPNIHLIVHTSPAFVSANDCIKYLLSQTKIRSSLSVHCNAADKC